MSQPNGHTVAAQPQQLRMAGGEFLTAEYGDPAQAFQRYGQDGAREQIGQLPQSLPVNPLSANRGGR